MKWEVKKKPMIIIKRPNADYFTGFCIYSTGLEAKSDQLAKGSEDNKSLKWKCQFNPCNASMREGNVCFCTLEHKS